MCAHLVSYPCFHLSEKDERRDYYDEVDVHFKGVFYFPFPNWLSFLSISILILSHSFFAFSTRYTDDDDDDDDADNDDDDDEAMMMIQNGPFNVSPLVNLSHGALLNGFP